MITEDYVSFETAKLLEDKGFKGDINAYYHIWDNGNKVCSILEFSRSEAPHLYIPAPTQSMAMKWLRKKYNIHIEPRYFPIPNIYRYVIIRSPFTIENIDSHPQYFNSYEEACEAAIKYCLENLIQLWQNIE